jgi:hypothetical protein
MRRAAFLGLALGLAACSDEGLNPIVDAAWKEVSPFGTEVEVAPAGQPITRAAVVRADVAMIRARLLTDESPTYLLAAANNGGYITYASALRQTLTLRGAWITGSRGLGWDLLSATSSQPDPLVQPIPPSRWPARVTRSYEFPDDGPQGRIETFTCTYEPGEVREITILEEVHRGQEMSETCTGPSGSFENLHLVAGDGAVWRSLQWLGPQEGHVDLEIVLPYTG